MTLDTHRAVWAEDGAPIMICYLDDQLWPCAHTTKEES